MKPDDLRKAQTEMRSRAKGDLARIRPSASPSCDPAFEKHYKVPDLVSLWGMSPKVVRDLFKDEEGVARIMQPTGKSQRVTLFIPESVAARVHQRLTVRLTRRPLKKIDSGLYFGFGKKKKPPVRVKEELRKIQAEAKQA